MERDMEEMEGDGHGGFADGLVDQCNVFVKYLPPDLDDKEFQRMFKQHGTVVSSKIMIDQATGKSLGYGFVRYNSPHAAQKCIDSMNGMRVQNKRLLCKLANQQKVAPQDPPRAPLLSAQFPSTNVYVKPLLPTTTEDDMRSIFSSFGEIVDCKVMVDRVTGLSRQIGFVRFADVESATKCIEEMNGYRLSPNAPPLNVKYADTREQKEARIQHRQQTRTVRPTTFPFGDGLSLPNPPGSPVYYYYPPLPSYGYPPPPYSYQPQPGGNFSPFSPFPAFGAPFTPPGSPMVLEDGGGETSVEGIPPSSPAPSSSSSTPSAQPVGSTSGTGVPPPAGTAPLPFLPSQGPIHPYPIPPYGASYPPMPPLPKTVN